MLLGVFTTSPMLALTYRKQNQGLTEVPSDITGNTIILYLSQNNLGNASFKSLQGLALEKLTLVSNGMTLFPDLTVVGSTLMILALGINDISTIPTGRLSGMTVLQSLYLPHNKFQLFPDLSSVGNTLETLEFESNMLRAVLTTDLDQLTCLKELDISFNSHLGISDLSPLSNTLENLNIESSGNPGTIDLENAFTNLQKLNTLQISDIGLKEFPNMNTSCGSLTNMFASGNDISDIPFLYIESCVAVEHLDLSGNSLSSFSNLSAMGQTLKQLGLNSNRIKGINQDFVRALTVLEEIYMDTNLLESFPDVSGSGNTLRILSLKDNNISYADPNITRSLTALEFVYCDSTNFMLFQISQSLVQQ